jgi:WD40 repeat protein
MKPVNAEEDGRVQDRDKVTPDANALIWHGHISPPLCVVGATNIVELVKVGKTEHFTRPDISADRLSISDVHVYKNSISAANRGGLLLPQGTYGKKVIRYGGPGCGFSVLATSSVTGGLSSAAAGISSASISSGMGGSTLSNMVAGMTGNSKPIPANQGARYNNVVADQDKEVFSVHDRLHEGAITCMVSSRDGMRLFSGSTDCSIRIWSTEHLLTSRKIHHVFTLVGHSNPVVCLDFCSEFNMLVSGCDNGIACLWDTRTGQLLRTLSPGADSQQVAHPILSVSMSSVSGMVATLTRSVLRIYSINGHSYVTQELLPGRSSGKAVDADGQVVLAVSTAEWQDGIVCITGHASGSVVFWKMQTKVTIIDPKESKYSLPCTTSTGVSSSGKERDVQKSLQVAYTLPRTHTAAITTLKLISSETASTAMQSVMGTKKDVINRAHSDASTWELFVGDSAGCVSRWSAQKLDNLLTSDKIAVVVET